MLAMSISERRSEHPLSHPAFLLALLVLGLNDHVWKGSGLLPGWLTGKLSDLGGLVVAPVLVAQLCRGPLARAKRVAPALVVLCFVLCKLFPSCAHVFESATALLGWRSRLIADPSDLIALVVLPLTLLLLRAGAEPSVPLRWRERIVLVSSLILCAATSPAPSYPWGPFLVNHSGEAVTLQARWLAAPEACTATPSRLRQLVADQSGAVVHSLRLQPAQVAKLAYEPSPMRPIIGRCPDAVDADAGSGDAGSADCVAVELSGNGVMHAIVRAPRYRRSSEASACRDPLPIYEDPGGGAIALVHDADGRTHLHVHGGVELIPLD
jgi:hypothetical protein